MSGDTPSSPIDLTCDEKVAVIDLYAASPTQPVSQDSRSSVWSDDDYDPGLEQPTPPSPTPTTPSSEMKTPPPMDSPTSPPPLKRKKTKLSEVCEWCRHPRLPADGIYISDPHCGLVFLCTKCQD